jgi:lipoprotein-anchoring transpeptidase ErfK/SrfK
LRVHAFTVLALLVTTAPLAASSEIRVRRPVDVAEFMLGPSPEELRPKARPRPPPLDPSAPKGLRLLINIPARKLRVYRDQELQEEMPIAVGRRLYPGETGNTRTRIGSYRITSWHKNYRSRNYPVPWNVDPWRGAFGAFTAKLGPRASYQYLHGTVGPMDLGDWLIHKRDPPPPGDGDPVGDFAVRARESERGLSHGCVRLSNRNIARLRELAPVGTPVEKFYCLRERHRLPSGEATLVTLPNVYRYRKFDREAVFDVATGRLEEYQHPRDAKGPR